MDTAEPLTKTPTKKRRVSWIDERLKKPLHQVKYIAKENVGKKVQEKISSDTEGDMCVDISSRCNDLCCMVRACCLYAACMPRT